MPPSPPLRPARYLVCHLPAFRLERCGWQAREQVALVAEQRNALRVLDCSAAASRCGLRPSMTLSEARALVPDLRVELLDELGEREDLAELCQQLQRVSPAVASLPPAALAAELELGLGQERERLRLRQVRQRMNELGHQVRIAVAEDLFGARLLAAAGGRDRIVPSGELAQALAPLPLDSLALAPRLAGLLRDLGLRQVGQLAALSASAVAGRFGAQGLRLHRLARGELGSLPLAAGEEDGGFGHAQELPFSVDAVEPLLFVLNRLCVQLCACLERAGRATSSLGIDLDLEESDALRLAFRVGRPCRDPALLSRLLRRRLEDLRLGAPVLGVALRALDAVPFSGAQAVLLAGGEQDLGPQSVQLALPQLLAQLADGLGPEALATPAARDSWRPEAAWEPRSASGADSALCQALLVGWRQQALPSRFKEGLREEDPGWVHEAWRLAEPQPRPALLLAEPQPVELLPEQGPPRRVRLAGRWQEVVSCSSAERLVGEWWCAGFERAYWDLRLADGRRVWVYRELGHGFLHGLFDQGAPAAAGAR